MPYSKYPETDTYVKLRNWWVESTKMYADFDDHYNKVELFTAPKPDPGQTIGDKVTFYITSGHPDPTRYAGVIIGVNFFDSYDSATYEIDW